MVSRPRRNTLIVLVVSLTAVVIVSGIPLYSVAPGPSADASEEPMVQLGDDGPMIWPYATVGRSFDRPVSPINLIFDEDPDTVKQLFRERTIAGWNVTDDENVSVDHVEQGLPWQEIHSRDRFVYVAAGPDGEGEWLRPAYQLHSGDYFGAQFHLRVYDAGAGTGDWTAVQAHGEHWDWFTLTHHVDSFEQPRQRIESQFIDSPELVSVDRVYFRNGDVLDADGWTTVVQLTAGLFLPVGAFAGRTIRRTRTPTTRRLALFLGLGGLVLLVRGLGIGGEVAGLDPDYVSKVVYLGMIFGTPATAAALGRRLPSPDAFALASVGYGMGVIADYMFLSVGVLPVGIVVHRVFACVALGGIAASGVALDLSEIRENELLLVGSLLWALVVIVPLL